MIESYGSSAIANAAIEPLEIWESPSLIPYLIHLEHPEFASLCPRSGYPDSGTIVIDYIPHRFTVELKAIKLYINSFRNEKISHEGVINAIADKFFKDVQPRSLRVIGDFMRRGGVKTVITVQRGDRYDFASYQANIL
ncbi:MAG: preQ(1) synthase [Timaviella obliquedivisa GSE-PSE-MK23-08B]|jgi:7-cyano-7-deazaguanine reductase|nr:preQ(1) synthase [Timaviella obliquedivisa GSE-PSE-MK23-08B]